MGLLDKLFGRKENPEVQRRDAQERCENGMMNISATINLPASGRAKCPQCGSPLPVAAEHMRAMMQQMDPDAIPMTICHNCDAQIRVRR